MRALRSPSVRICVKVMIIPLWADYRFLTAETNGHKAIYIYIYTLHLTSISREFYDVEKVGSAR